MKTTAIVAVLDLLEQAWKRVDDIAEARVMVAKARDELAALTPPTPEDVAREHAEARRFFAIFAPDPGKGSQAESSLAALARLATAAARVPGLEAELARAEHNRQVAEQSAAENVAERRTQLARAVAAESERDAARQEAATLQDNFQQAMEAAEHERERAELGWDTERQRAREVGTLAARVAELEERLIDAGLCARGDHKLEEHDEHGRHSLCGAGTPTTTQPEVTLGERDHARDESERLREQVATLEREVREQDERRLATECDLTTAGISVDDGLHDAVHVLIRKREAAERRVAELEELTWDLVRVGVLMFEGAEERADANARTATRQADRATAAEVKAVGARDATLEEAKRTLMEEMGFAADGEVAEVLDGMKSQPAPTPAPGLREAVGSVFATLKDMGQMGALLAADAEAMAVVGGIPTEQWRNLMDWLERRFLSTAAEPVVTHAQLAAVVETYAKEMESDGNDYEYSRAEGAREVLCRVTGGQVPEVSAWKDKAAKWDAAVGRFEHEQRAGSQRAFLEYAHVILTGDVLPTGPGGGETRPPEPIDFPPSISSLVGEQQRRARIAPTPTPEGPALATEGKTWWACACGWSGRASALRPTPAGGLACPTCGGTGGLESQPVPDEGPSGLLMARFARGEVVPSRPLAATESTPESPTLERECADVVQRSGFGGAVAWAQESAPRPALARGTHDDRTCGACDGPLETSRDAVCETCAPESTAHATAESMAQPAPKVVWEGDGVRVYSDGEWERMSADASGAVSDILARALAEEKREQEAAWVILRKQFPVDKLGVSLAEVCESLMSETQAARKAAEDMRERCLTIIWDRIKAGKDDLRGAWEEIHAMKEAE